tara:strand:- start:151 stop:741 length:591 start_codon:yes stop_codon:yes gene_type:complete
MVDVIKHSLFPTIINSFEFDMDEKEYNLVINKLNNIEKSREELIIQTTDNLFIDIPKFANSIGIITEKICEDLNYKYESIEMTGMWANKLIKGEVHPPHTHSNNIFSGVYYLEGGSQIQFFDPRPQASVLQIDVTKVTQSNASMLAFDSQKGAGLIFPSWLTHWVPVTDKTRISISWNILLRGDYGQPGTLQNSHI